MPLLKDRTIRKRVLAVIEGRIQQAQSDFDNGCESLDDQYEEDVKLADNRRETGKTNLADKLVSGILGKVL